MTVTEYTSSKQGEAGSLYNPKNCKLFEVVQYKCEVTRENIECTPFVRLFLRCAGIPTIEVTPDYDEYGDPLSR